MDKITAHLPRIKNGLHGAQAFCIFIGGIMDIVFLVKGEQSGGAIIFYLVLCFLTLPAIVYNSMTLWFERSRRWGNAYAFAALDLVFCIVWLAAFASVAAFNGTGKCNPACGVAKGMVGLGFFIFLFFALTTAISIQNALYYRAHGSMPLSNQRVSPSSIDPDRDAFSTAPHDLYAPLGGAHDDDDEHDQHNDAGFASHRRASNDLYSGGAPMEGGRYGLPSYNNDHDAGHSNIHGDDPFSPVSGGGAGAGRGGFIDAKDDGDHLGRFDHEILAASGRHSVLGTGGMGMSGGGGSRIGRTAAMPYGPDSYQETGYAGGGGHPATGYKAPRVEEEDGRVQFPAAPYGV